MKQVALVIIALLSIGCAKKSEIMGGTLCVKCGNDLPSWRNGYCPKCYHMPEEVRNNLVRWDVMEDNLNRLVAANKLRNQQ